MGHEQTLPMIIGQVFIVAFIFLNTTVSAYSSYLRRKQETEDRAKERAEAKAEREETARKLLEAQMKTAEVVKQASAERAAEITAKVEELHSAVKENTQSTENAIQAANGFNEKLAVVVKSVGTVAQPTSASSKTTKVTDEHREEVQYVGGKPPESDQP